MTLRFTSLFRTKVAALSLAAACAGVSAEDAKISFNSAGWIQYGRIEKSLDTVAMLDLNGAGMQGGGAQFGMAYQASERLQLNAGVGMAFWHSVAGRYTSGGFAPMYTTPYVSAANLDYQLLDGESMKLSGQVGLFPYDYAPEAQNLGLYLFRGPVYPGFLTSGFETKYVLPVANTLGLRLHNEQGSFEHDLLFTFDTDWFPFWDISPAYIAAYHFGKALRIGGGAQLYHLIPADDKLTNAKTDAVAYVDTSNSPILDTTYISFAGVKLMGNFAFDPKALWGQDGEDGMLGAEDLKIYGEVGVLGLDGDKPHNDLFGPVSKRMPMMIGFNLPAFKVLDRLNVELEYYGAPWVDDPTIYEHTRSNHVTPIPKLSALDTNNTKDNFKWSIYASKVVAKHVKFSAQAASDHFRPGVFKGYGDSAPPQTEVPFFSPKEWYWMTKIAYFF